MHNNIEFLKSKDSENILKLFSTNNKIKVLEEFSEVLDKRAYITIDFLGNIKKKKMNMVVPAFAFLDDSKTLTELLLDSSDLREKTNIEKIERYSSKDINKVKQNFIKTIFNGNLEFSKRYGKELFLRDREEFFKILGNFIFLGEFDSMKSLMALALRKLLKNTWSDDIFYLAISYLTKYRDNIFDYSTIVVDNNISIEELINLINTNEKLRDSYQGFCYITALNYLKEIKLENKPLYLTRIKKEISSVATFTQLTAIEKEIYNYFL